MGEVRPSLARRARVRTSPARGGGNLLAPVYGWFIEGFDTPDLQETKALFDE
jgi:hypothetical protein